MIAVARYIWIRHHNLFHGLLIWFWQLTYSDGVKVRVSGGANIPFHTYLSFPPQILLHKLRFPLECQVLIMMNTIYILSLLGMMMIDIDMRACWGWWWLILKGATSQNSWLGFFPFFFSSPSHSRCMIIRIIMVIFLFFILEMHDFTLRPYCNHFLDQMSRPGNQDPNWELGDTGREFSLQVIHNKPGTPQNNPGKPQNNPGKPQNNQLKS